MAVIPVPSYIDYESAAALAGLELLGDDKYLAVFLRAHGWFHGQNSLEQPLADVQARFALAVQASQQPGASAQVWINRYGYLSASKLAALGRFMRSGALP